MSISATQLLNTAVEAGRKAGRYLRENTGNIGEQAVDEKRKNDFVTAVDRQSERLIIDHIRSVFPDHDILAEESGRSSKAGSYRWIIDPLDGTTNFLHQIPVFCVSIAAQHGDELLAGMVYNPLQEELFTAVKGGGAYLNDRPIRVSDTHDFSRALLATGFPHQAKLYLPPFLRAFSEIYYYAAGVRRLGSAALDLCYTACGRFEGYWELDLNPWDIAAGSLLVQEAGGVVSDFWGTANYLQSGFLIAGNPSTHQRIRSILINHFEENSDERSKSH